MQHKRPSDKVVTDAITDLGQLRRASQRPPPAIVHDEEIEKITRLMKPGAMPLEDVEGLPKGIVGGSNTPKREARKHYIQLDGGQVMHVTAYLGRDWENHIRNLHQIEPLQIPEHIAETPHNYQLKAAAQADWLCRSPLRGMILGDGMGVGKTFTAILAMWIVKDEPGLSLVVAPKTLCAQWVKYINTAFEEGHGLSAYLFEGSSSKTAHQLLDMGVDVIVTSYDQVDAAERALRRLQNEIAAYKKSPETTTKPKRVLATLHDPIWRRNGIPFKRLILDEAQCINKRHGTRHQAVKRLPYKAVIQLSGTMAHNKWYDVSGYIDLLQGHPFKTDDDFLRTFAINEETGDHVKGQEMDLAHSALLQRFLQGFTIARPSSILNLPKCDRSALRFWISDDAATESDELVNKYRKLNSFLKKKGQAETTNLMGLLIRAQTITLHPLLSRDDNNSDDEDQFVDVSEDPNPDLEYVERAADLPSPNDQKREEWLAKVDRAARSGELCVDAGRLEQVIGAYLECRHKFPNSKILIFSQSLKFLDLIEALLKYRFTQPVLRYDGSVSHKERPKIRQSFSDGPPSVPLLLTMGAGSFGLNLTCASIVIQTEVWWNLNTEEQALCRVLRQGQKEEVKYIKLIAHNCKIDTFMLEAQERKAQKTISLMQAIIRNPEAPLDIIPILLQEQ